MKSVKLTIDLKQQKIILLDKEATDDVDGGFISPDGFGMRLSFPVRGDKGQWSQITLDNINFMEFQIEVIGKSGSWSSQMVGSDVAPIESLEKKTILPTHKKCGGDGLKVGEFCAVCEMDKVGREERSV